MSKIQVNVKWDTQATFAGEEVECIITFQNATQPPSSSVSLLSNASHRAMGSRRSQRKLDLLGSQPRPTGVAFSSGNPSFQGQEARRMDSQYDRPSTTASYQPSSGQYSLHGKPEYQRNHMSRLNPRNHHSRSISIISMGSRSSSGSAGQNNTGSKPSAVGKKSHSRSASLQNMPDRRGSRPHNLDEATPWLVGREPLNSTRATIQGPPLQSQSYEKGDSLLESREKLETSGKRLQNTGRLSGIVEHEPAQTNINLPVLTSVSAVTAPLMTVAQLRDTSQSQVLSPLSNSATPRSSLEIYSQSNHSTETLASEYAPSGMLNSPTERVISTRGSRLATSASVSGRPEVLMMGYVQLLGSFTLDGSLINQAPFEAIKKRSIIGGQDGGGVVGIKASKRDNGLLGALGWNSISQSFGGLIGGHEPSSMRSMKGIVNAKAIPIISTPQSVLFVDLKLRAGESQSFRYKHRLPESIPPTCRGRAIKVGYHLAIGIQRPHSVSQSHHLRHVNVPFRVLPSISSSGKLPTHNLRSPYVILQDSADCRILSDGAETQQRIPRKHPASSDPSETAFTSYVANLLNDCYDTSNSTLQSPTISSDPSDASRIRLNSTVSMRERIDLQLFRGDSLGKAGLGANRFEIHRTGRRVATIALGRTVYKLGDTIVASVDFCRAPIPCYSVHAHLESTEEVDETLALRSSASILRATRRTYASQFETTVCARRVAFKFTIPFGATPDFRTTGVGLKWTLRVEFNTKPQDVDGAEPELFEEVTADERGYITGAAQELVTDSFEVLVPLRVYGAPNDGEVVGNSVSFTL